MKLLLERLVCSWSACTQLPGPDGTLLWALLLLATRHIAPYLERHENFNKFASAMPGAVVALSMAGILWCSLGWPQATLPSGRPSATLAFIACWIVSRAVCVHQLGAAEALPAIAAASALDAVAAAVHISQAAGQPLLLAFLQIAALHGLCLLASHKLASCLGNRAPAGTTGQVAAQQLADAAAAAEGTAVAEQTRAAAQHDDVQPSVAVNRASSPANNREASGALQPSVHQPTQTSPQASEAPTAGHAPAQPPPAAEAKEGTAAAVAPSQPATTAPKHAEVLAAARSDGLRILGNRLLQAGVIPVPDAATGSRAPAQQYAGAQSQQEQYKHQEQYKQATLQALASMQARGHLQPSMSMSSGLTEQDPSSVNSEGVSLRMKELEGRASGGADSTLEGAPHRPSSTYGSTCPPSSITTASTWTASMGQGPASLVDGAGSCYSVASLSQLLGRSSAHRSNTGLTMAHNSLIAIGEEPADLSGPGQLQGQGVRLDAFQLARALVLAPTAAQALARPQQQPLPLPLPPAPQAPASHTVSTEAPGTSAGAAAAAAAAAVATAGAAAEAAPEAGRQAGLTAQQQEQLRMAQQLGAALRTYVPISPPVQRVSLKIHGADPEDLKADVATAFKDLMAQHGCQLHAHYVRQGCIHIDLDVEPQGGGVGGGVGVAAVGAAAGVAAAQPAPQAVPQPGPVAPAAAAAGLGAAAPALAGPAAGTTPTAHPASAPAQAAGGLQDAAAGPSTAAAAAATAAGPAPRTPQSRAPGSPAAAAEGRRQDQGAAGPSTPPAGASGAGAVAIPAASPLAASATVPHQAPSPTEQFVANRASALLHVAQAIQQEQRLRGPPSSSEGSNGTGWSTHSTMLSGHGHGVGGEGSIHAGGPTRISLELMHTGVRASSPQQAGMAGYAPGGSSQGFTSGSVGPGTAQASSAGSRRGSGEAAVPDPAAIIEVLAGLSLEGGDGQAPGVTAMMVQHPSGVVARAALGSGSGATSSEEPRTSDSTAASRAPFVPELIALLPCAAHASAHARGTGPQQQERFVTAYVLGKLLAPGTAALPSVFVRAGVVSGQAGQLGMYLPAQVELVLPSQYPDLPLSQGLKQVLPDQAPDLQGSQAAGSAQAAAGGRAGAREVDPGQSAGVGADHAAGPAAGTAASAAPAQALLPHVLKVTVALPPSVVHGPVLSIEVEGEDGLLSVPLPLLLCPEAGLAEELASLGPSDLEGPLAAWAAAHAAGGASAGYAAAAYMQALASVSGLLWDLSRWMVKTQGGHGLHTDGSAGSATYSSSSSSSNRGQLDGGGAAAGASSPEELVRRGIRLLGYACARGWPSACTLLLEGLLSQPPQPPSAAGRYVPGHAHHQAPQLPRGPVVRVTSLSEVDALVAQDNGGLGITHLAATSGSDATLVALSAWAAARGQELDWARPGPQGLTALHLMAARGMDWRAQSPLLVLAVACPQLHLLWRTVRCEGGSTPEDFMQRWSVEAPTDWTATPAAAAVLSAAGRSSTPGPLGEAVEELDIDLSALLPAAVTISQLTTQPPRPARFPSVPVVRPASSHCALPASAVTEAAHASACAGAGQGQGGPSSTGASPWASHNNGVLVHWLEAAESAAAAANAAAAAGTTPQHGEAELSGVRMGGPPRSYVRAWSAPHSNQVQALSGAGAPVRPISDAATTADVQGPRSSDLASLLPSRMEVAFASHDQGSWLKRRSRGIARWATQGSITEGTALQRGMSQTLSPQGGSSQQEARHKLGGGSSESSGQAATIRKSLAAMIVRKLGGASSSGGVGPASQEDFLIAKHHKQRQAPPAAGAGAAAAATAVAAQPSPQQPQPQGPSVGASRLASRKLSSLASKIAQLLPGSHDSSSSSRLQPRFARTAPVSPAVSKGDSRLSMSRSSGLASGMHLLSGDSNRSSPACLVVPGSFSAGQLQSVGEGSSEGGGITDDQVSLSSVLMARMASLERNRRSSGGLLVARSDSPVPWDGPHVAGDVGPQPRSSAGYTVRWAPLEASSRSASPAPAIGVAQGVTEEGAEGEGEGEEDAYAGRGTQDEGGSRRAGRAVNSTLAHHLGPCTASAGTSAGAGAGAALSAQTAALQHLGVRASNASSCATVHDSSFSMAPRFPAAAAKLNLANAAAAAAAKPDPARKVSCLSDDSTSNAILDALWE